MVVDLIFCVGFESVEVTERDKVLQHFPIHKVAVALIRHYFLLGVVQDLKRKPNIQLPELKSKQVGQPSFEVSDVVLNVNCLVLVLQCLKHDA